MFSDLDLARDALNVLLQSGGSFAEFYAEKRISCSFRSSSPDFKARETSSEGVGLRIRARGRWFHGCCEGFSPDAVMESAKHLRDQVTGGHTDCQMAGYPEHCRKLSLDGTPEPPSLASPNLRRQCVETLFNAVHKEAPQASAMLIYQEHSQSVFIANSEGTCVTGRRHNVFAPVICQVSDEGGLSVGLGVAGGSCFPPMNQWQGAGAAAAVRANSFQRAQTPAMGSYPVAFTGEASGIFHEAVGHALEARFARDGVLAGKLGTRVAPSWLSVVDDPTIAGRGGSYKFDDEGTQAMPNKLIDRGVLVGFLTDRQSAEEHGFPLTGNGRRGSYRVPPLSRMSNTYICSGSQDPEEIVESMQSGILVKSVLSGRSGAVGGNFSVLVNEAYMVSSGKIRHPLGFFTLAGRTLDFLSGAKAVGNDLWIAPNGTCGLTPEQTIAVVSGSPTVLTGPLDLVMVHSPEEVLRAI